MSNILLDTFRENFKSPTGMFISSVTLNPFEYVSDTDTA
jgi:hypothetical protein